MTSMQLAKTDGVPYLPPELLPAKLQQAIASARQRLPSSEQD